MKKIIKWALIGFGGLMVLGIIMAATGGESNKSANQESKQVQPKQEGQAKPQEAIQLETSEFISEFDKNQLAAEEKYKGKLIEFTAYIDNISEDILGSPFLSLKPTNDEYYFDTSIQCFFEDKANLTSLQNGQKVTVQGTANTQDLGIIGVKDCKVIE